MYSKLSCEQYNKLKVWVQRKHAKSQVIDHAISKATIVLLFYLSVVLMSILATV